MKISRLTLPTAATLLSLGMSIAGNAAMADETYKRTSFYEDGAAVTFIAFSPDGERIAFAREDRVVRIRDTRPGNEIALLTVPSQMEEGDDYLQSMAFSPDGNRLATASQDGMLRVWDIADGRPLATLEHPSLVGIARFSPDGTRLATLTGHAEVRLWDIASGSQLAVLDHPAAVALVAFSQNGRTSSPAASTAQLTSGKSTPAQRSRSSRGMPTRWLMRVSAQTARASSRRPATTRRAPGMPRAGASFLL